MTTPAKPSAAALWREKQAKLKQAKQARTRRMMLAALLLAALLFWLAPHLRPLVCSATGIAC